MPLAPAGTVWARFPDLLAEVLEIGPLGKRFGHGVSPCRLRSAAQAEEEATQPQFKEIGGGLSPSRGPGGTLQTPVSTIDVRQDRALRHRFEIPDHALSLLKAQIFDWIAADAGPGSWLFITGKGQHPQPHTIANWVRQTAAKAHVWQPDEQLWPLWHPTPVTGYRVQIASFEPTWWIT